jgi:hypothetical protein
MRRRSLPLLTIPVAGTADRNAGRLLWLRVALGAVAFWSAVISFRAERSRPERTPAPLPAATARHRPGHVEVRHRPGHVEVTIWIDADKLPEPPDP